jgi:hypothetical protein
MMKSLPTRCGRGLGVEWEDWRVTIRRAVEVRWDVPRETHNRRAAVRDRDIFVAGCKFSRREENPPL